MDVEDREMARPLEDYSSLRTGGCPLPWNLSPECKPLRHVQVHTLNLGIGPPLISRRRCHCLSLGSKQGNKQIKRISYVFIHDMT